MTDSGDVIRWCATEGRRVEDELVLMAGRRRALRELAHLAMKCAHARRTIGCSIEALVAASADDPVAAADLQSVMRRVTDPDAQADDDQDNLYVLINPDQESDHAHHIRVR